MRSDKSTAPVPDPAMREAARKACESISQTSRLPHTIQSPNCSCEIIAAAIAKAVEERDREWQRTFGLSTPDAELAQAAYETIARKARAEAFEKAAVICDEQEARVTKTRTIWQIGHAYRAAAAAIRARAADRSES